MQSSTINAPLCQSNVTSLTAIGGFTPTTSAIVSGISVCNKTGAQVTVSVSLYNGSTDFYIAYNAPVGVGDTLLVGGANYKAMLVNGWYVRAQASGACDVTMSVLQAA